MNLDIQKTFLNAIICQQIQFPNKKNRLLKEYFGRKDKKYLDRLDTLETNMQIIYDLILGQCSPGIQSILQGRKGFIKKMMPMIASG